MSEDKPQETPKEEASVFVTEYQKKLLAQWEKTHTYTTTDAAGTATVVSIPAPLQVVGNGVRWVRRKERRMHNALYRKANDTRPKHDVQQAVMKYIRDTIQSKRTQDLIVSGKVDQWLPKQVEEKQTQLPESKSESQSTATSTETITE